MLEIRDNHVKEETLHLLIGYCFMTIIEKALVILLNSLQHLPFNLKRKKEKETKSEKCNRYRNHKLLLGVAGVPLSHGLQGKGLVSLSISM